ncbi:MAG: hypothetical protein ACLFST_01535 [Spirochaetia bacterium]
MKFKLIFIFFNTIIVFSFIFIFLVPILILGAEYTQVLWSKEWIWILSSFFAAVVIGMNIFFILNWTFFTHLEREDWDALTVYLEKQIYEKKKYRKQYIRILLNAYLVKGQTDKVHILRQHVQEERQNLLLDFALLFSIPDILKNDETAMEFYFKDLLEKEEIKKGKYKNIRLWSYFLLAFTLVVSNKYDEAGKYINYLLEKYSGTILKAFGMYLLSTFPEQGKREKADNLRKEFIRDMPREKWLKTVEREKSNLLLIVLSRFVNETTAWLYPEGMMPVQEEIS